MSTDAAPRPAAVLARIEGELRALWSSPPAPGETPRARACTMNLIVVAATPALAEQWLPIVDEVILGTPARAIVVSFDPDGTDALDAATTAVCTRADGGGPVICSERVTLAARGSVCAHVPSCVAAVCATDVPTTLVWPGRGLAGDPAFEPLARDASSRVLDSGDGSIASLAKVVYWARARAVADRPGVADLAWTRLGPWQEMCARMFDEPGLHALASRVTRVSLVQASSAEAPMGAEGLLLLGWLATRLGWKVGTTKNQAGRLMLRRGDGGQVEVSPVADAASKAPRNALLAVRLEAGDDAASIRGEIARGKGDPDAATWRLEVTRPGAEPQRLEQHVRLRATETAGLLERTLHRPTYDLALADSAAWADELGEAELSCGGAG